MKTALVTGSTRGIGRGIADLMSENGFKVIYCGTRPERPADIPQDCLYVGCNIADARQRGAAIDFCLREYGRLDVLVNNAGVAPAKREDILQTSEESFDRVLDINLKGTFFLCQAAALAMLDGLEKLKDYHPRIVNIGSISARVSSIARPEYCISKAGLGMVTQLFAHRLAEAGIPVFEVRPGIIATGMTTAVHDQYQQMLEAGLTPIRRFGTPLDVAKMVLACCEGYLDFSAGQVLNADGGFMLRRL